jgi:hypothetical protein
MNSNTFAIRSHDSLLSVYRRAKANDVKSLEAQRDLLFNELAKYVSQKHEQERIIDDMKRTVRPAHFPLVSC